MDEIISLDYGSGGKKTSRLIEQTILPVLDNPYLGELGDGAVLPGAEKLVFSTDSFVVDPLFFPGGDIGKLAVCGTVNDLAMCGAEPKYLSLALILEEGFPLRDLERVMASLGAAAEKAGVTVVTGDTPVAEAVEVKAVPSFEKGDNKVKLYKQSGYLEQTNIYDRRRFSVSVKYNFNPAKSKYKGTGAGNDEKSRLN